MFERVQPGFQGLCVTHSKVLKGSPAVSTIFGAVWGSFVCFLPRPVNAALLEEGQMQWLLPHFFHCTSDVSKWKTAFHGVFLLIAQAEQGHFNSAWPKQPLERAFDISALALIVCHMLVPISQVLCESQDTQFQGVSGVPRPSSPIPSPGKGPRPSSRDGVTEGVGEEDPQGAQGFHVGLAPANLRPPKGIDTGQKLNNQSIKRV